MNLEFQTAWRNLWRNSRRTWITVGAVALNTAVLIITLAYVDGTLAHIVDSAVNIVTGEAQIHDAEYLASRSLYDVVEDAPGVMQKLAERNVPAVARSFGYGLVASGNKSSGARFWGVDPVRERQLFELSGYVQSGEFLAPDAAGRVVLGKKLARAVKAGVGSELVAVVQAADGSLGNELFTVGGVLKSSGELIDRSAVFLHRDDFERLFVSGGRVHEIAVNTHGAMPLSEVAATCRTAASDEETRTWRELQPGLNEMLNATGVSMWIFQIIFFLAAGLGVLNTMLMATFERFREFGIMKAVGASPWRIVRGVSMEAVLLGLCATLVGAALGLAGAWYMQVHGLDLRSFISGDTSVVGVAFDPVMRAKLSVKGVLLPVVSMWVVCGLASLYPALVAARLDPVKTMQHV